MRGYGAYRGRSRGRTFLKILILVLVALLIATVVAFFRLEPYIIYTSDGIRLDLPGHGEDTAPPSAPAVDPPVIIVTPEPTPTPEPEVFMALQLPRSALVEGTAEEQLREAGANAAVFDMKADDGSLGYVSDLELARTTGASSAEPGLNEAIRQLTGGDVYTVARVSCFRDNTVPYNDNSTALRTAIGNWRDRENIRWLSPARESACEYVAGICRELAALGFDEILLDYPAFPTESDGSLDNLTVGEAYPAEALETAVEEFYSAVRAALAGYPATMLSIVSSEAGLSGDPADQSGQTVSQLAEYADRVWAPEPVQSTSNYAGALEAAGMEDAGIRLVLMTDALPVGEAGFWAVMDLNN